MNEIPEQMVTQFATEWLMARGYSVTPIPDIKWHSFAEVAAMAKMAKPTLSQKLKHKDCPAFNARSGESGRTIALQLNEPLCQYLNICRP